MIRKRRHRLAFENLERRDVPAILGPWGDPTHLTVSFAPDGTPIAGHVSGLFASLNSRQATAAWEGAILQAFQTWAVQTNINLSLVTDSGLAFGTPGPSQHDPRFGDIRVGAQAMSADVMAITVPGDPAVPGSWTGDVLFNTQYAYGQKGGPDLFSVALHEAGHALGLADSTDPKSVMYTNYLDAQSLSSGDIAAIQTLYGTRTPDLHEGSGGNDSPSKAATIQPPGSFDGTTPLVVFGDVSSAKDLDYYAFRGPSGYTGPATIRLQSAGISLLTTRLTILDASGKAIIGQAKASSDTGDVVSIQLPQINPNATYTVLVQGTTSDVFGVGHYGLAVSFDGRNKVAPATLDAVLRDDYQTLSNNDIDALLRDPSHTLLNDAHHSDETAATAIRLTSTPGYPTNTHYEAIGSLADPSDSVVYRIQTPNVSGSQPNVLTVTLRSLAPGGVAPRVTLVDEFLNPLAGSVRVLANGDGVYTIQAVNLKSGGNVYLKVSSGPVPGAVPGNYALEARFGGVAATLTDFASGTFTPAAPPTYQLYVGKTQLFRFLLSAGSSATPGGTVNLTIRDATGKVVATLSSADGDVASAPAVLLTPGTYTLRVVATGIGTSAQTFDLSGQVISDPLGPAISDPTLNPVFTTPTSPGTYTYPGGIVTIKPYWISLIS